ncbi:MAG TPA: hypothetical protein VEX14_02460 [Burkholderiaceae bacterium]|nr:hypothetical protein [Burkholderiaceae bacterium]
MNTHPIDSAALAAATPASAHAAAARTRETLVQQCAALMRQLADAMLANVQNTASLNLTAARAVLAHARIPTPANLQHRSDTWRQSWRSFEICATSADQVLNLTRGHVERTTQALWRTTERLLDDMQQLDGARGTALRQAFHTARASQAALWQATQQVHHELVALAQSPLLRDAEPDHGPH